MRLVHQNVVDAAVQTIQHPRSDAVVGQQVLCLADQIIKIQPAAPLFGLRIALGKSRGKPVQGNRVFRGDQGQPFLPRVFNTIDQCIELGKQMRRRGLCALGREGLFRCTRLCQERRFGDGQTVRVQCHHLLQGLAHGTVAHALANKDRDQLLQHVPIVRRKGLFQDSCLRQTARLTQQLKRVIQGQVPERCRIARDFLGQRQEIFALVEAGHTGKHLGIWPVRHLIHEVGTQQIGCAVLDLCKLRADPCFARETPE